MIFPLIVVDLLITIRGRKLSEKFLTYFFFQRGVNIMRLASRFGRYNSIRRERPLTDDELMQFVPSVFSGDKHESRSERYT
ncbi:hypothetical protein GQN25_25595, partial [Escherichia coli]|nr:hypothetical protein [Escherichia coli]